MSARIVSVILILTCGILGFLLYRSQHTTEELRRQSRAGFFALSNSLHVASARLDTQQRLNFSMETNLNRTFREFQSLSNRLNQLQQDLVQTQAEAIRDREQAAQTIQQRDRQIQELELERNRLALETDTARQELATLSQSIRETERRLAISEGDRRFLQDELRGLMRQKADLEQRMTDVVYLRDRIQKLHDEKAVVSPMELLRQGFQASEQTNGSALTNRFRPDAKPTFDSSLHVELSLDGAVVVPAPDTKPGTP